MQALRNLKLKCYILLQTYGRFGPSKKICSWKFEIIICTLYSENHAKTATQKNEINQNNVRLMRIWRRWTCFNVSFIEEDDWLGKACCGNFEDNCGRELEEPLVFSKSWLGCLAVGSLVVMVDKKGMLAWRKLLLCILVHLEIWKERNKLTPLFPSMDCCLLGGIVYFFFLYG